MSHSAALLDAATRRAAIANAQALARAARGRGIIIASGAHAAFQLRGPADIANLAFLFGLNGKQAKVCIDHLLALHHSECALTGSHALAQAAIGANCANVLQHAAARRMYKGVISIRSIQQGDTGLAMPDPAIPLDPAKASQTQCESATANSVGPSAQPLNEPIVKAESNKKRKLAKPSEPGPQPVETIT